MFYPKVVGLTLLLLVGGLLCSDYIGCGLTNLAAKSAPENSTLQISVEEVQLNPEVPENTNVGFLKYRGGLEIKSDAPVFGGFSSLVLTPKGDGLIALTDHGDVLKGSFVTNKDNRLIGLKNISSHPLRGLDGKYLSRKLDKWNQDAEAIASLKDGSFLVSFERRHRILRYNALEAQPSLFSVPPGIEKAPINGGIESMVALSDGRILILTEKYRTKGRNKGDYIGWLLDKDGVSLGNIFWRGADSFRPTDFAVLPNGDVLILQRRYTIMNGLAMRLSLISAQQIKPGARISGLELAQLMPPYTVDNFEGLAVHSDKIGGIMIYIMSDDNFNPLQRTLLLKFSLER